MAGKLFVFIHLWKYLDLLGTVVMQYDLFQGFSLAQSRHITGLVSCIHETRDTVCS